MIFYRALTFFLLGFMAISASAQQINWLKDFNEAKAHARQTGKPILLNFTAEWCGVCRVMDKDFWPRADVAKFAGRFVAVKVDFGGNVDLREQYYVRNTPYVLFLDPWGNLLTSFVGFGKNADKELMRRGSLVPGDFTSIKAEIELLETAPNNKTALAKAADFYYDNKFYSSGSRFYNRLVKLETSPAKREPLLARIAFSYLRNMQNEMALDALSKLEKEFPATQFADAVLYVRIVIYVRRESPVEAQKLLEKLKTRYPGSAYLEESNRLVAQSLAAKKN
jgi:thiol-disulfide isomerase/thioredoxin